MCSAIDNEGHLKVYLTLIFKVNCLDQVTYVGHFEILNMFKLTARMSLYHVYNKWWTRGHNE